MNEWYSCLGVGTLAVLLILGTPFVAVVGGIILAGLKIWKGSSARQRQEEEARLIQELYRGLSRMEERVEALETLLLERERKREGLR